MARALFVLLLLHAFERVQSSAVLQSLPTTAADNVVDAIHGWTPKPTEGPRFGPRLQLERQGRPGMAARDLFGRQDAIDTCGWYNADADAPQTCSFGSACAYFTSAKPHLFSCCPTLDGEIDWDNCPYYGTCLTYDSLSAPNTYTGSYALYGSSSAILW